MSTEAAGERLRRLRRADSAAKAAQVRAALEATVAAGGPLSVSHIARTAAVSRRFVYDHPELRAEIDLRAAEAAAVFSGRLMGAARVSGASLRADLENSKAHNKRLRERNRVLEGRLSRTLGQEVAAELAGTGVLVGESALRERMASLEARVEELTDELRRRDEDLEGARRANRELMTEINRLGPRR